MVYLKNLQHIPVGGATKSQDGSNYLISLHPSSRTVEAESHTKGTAPLCLGLQLPKKMEEEEHVEEREDKEGEDGREDGCGPLLGALVID